MALTHTIARLRTALADVPEHDRATATAVFALDFDEHFAYQRAQSEAHAAGRLSRDDALTIYAALGEHFTGDGWATNTDLATRIAVSHAMKPILEWQLGVAA